MTAPAPQLLIVDDDPGVLRLFEKTLTREGYRITTAATAEAAMRSLKDAPPDLILIDLNLGDESGQRVLDQLPRTESATPFIIITGQGDERVAVDMMKRGALDYVIKGSGMVEFLPGIVRRALDAIEQRRSLEEARLKLIRSEEHHRNVIHTALDGYLEFDSNACIHEVNESLCELLGYARDQLTRMRIFDVEASLTEDEVLSRIQEVQRNGSGRFFTRLRRSDGSVCHVEVSCRFDGTALFAFVHNLTEQRRLERALIEAGERERRAIGRDLHDGLGQQLTGVGMMAQTLVRKLQGDSAHLIDQAEGLARQIREAITVTRQLSHGLSPVSLEADGLMNALRELADSVTRIAGVRCDFHCTKTVHVPDSSAATHLYRIAQEAVNNALKHAGARKIRISLVERPTRIELIVEDDGQGIKTRQGRKSGMGLEVMEYRARLVGARLEIASHPKRGVRVGCSLEKAA